MSIAERALAGHITKLPHAQRLLVGVRDVAAPPSPVVPARRLAARARSSAVAADGCAAAALASAAPLSPSPDRRGPPPMDSLSLQALAGTIANGSTVTDNTSNDNSSTAAAAPSPGTGFDPPSTTFASQVPTSLSPAAVQRLPVPLQTLQPLGAEAAAAAPGRRSLRSRWPRAAAEAAVASTGAVTATADSNAQDAVHAADVISSIPAHDVHRNGGNGSSSSSSISSSPEAHVLGTDEFRVAYQGVPGAYSEMAAVKAYPNCCAVPCNQFEDAFKAVEQWVVDKAVLPIENSLGGSIHRNYDLLLRYRLHIVGEVQLAVNHCLLALPGTQVRDIRRVLSHPQALAQVEMTLTRMGSMVREAVDDTAGAAMTVAQERLQNVAAVASLRAAEIYGLEVLAEGIQDDPDNITRFLVLAREPILPANDRPFKTSIVFTLERGPGVLFKALSVFALRDINLTKIESRPQREKPLLLYPNPSAAAPQWPSSTSDAAAKLPSDSPPSQSSAAASSSYQMFDYLFYIDFQASLAEQRAQNALRHLQEFAPFLRVLGSYPMDLSSNARL